MQLNKYKKYIIREIKEHFSDKALDFFVNRLNDEPYLDIEIEFTLYEYSIVRILVEKRTVFFTVRERNIGLKLFKSTILSVPEEETAEILGGVVLERLDREVKLRIPDKYLREKFPVQD